MEEQLLPEEQMQIEVEARNAFLFAADYDIEGVNHLMTVLAELKQRLIEAEQ
jgi:hypothetical protein